MRLKTILGLLILTACVCLLFFILLHREAIHDAPVRRSDCTLCGPVKTTGLQKAAILALDESKPTVPTGDALVDFDDWSGRYLQAGADQRAALVGEGVQRARERRPILKQLIKDSPRAAIEAAVPMVVRQQLPVEIVSLLEKRINQTGAFRVLMAMPLPGEAPVQPVRYETELKGGPTYETYPVQPPTSNKWIPGKAVNGIAIDSVLAMNDQPTREIELGEKPPIGKPVVFDCPVSGKQVLPANEVPVVINVPAAEGPEEVYLFCDGSHRTIQNEVLTVYAEGGTGGPQTFTGILPSTATPALGNVKVIVIPMTYADQNGVPSTEAALSTTLRDVADHYSKSSYGRISLTGVVTPPVKLKHNEAWYINRDTSNGGDISGTSVEMAEAREEARKLGFDWNDYDCTVVRHNGGPGSYGGLGGGSTVWVRSDGVSLWAHEIGHAFGLGHSNFWDTAGSSSIGAGANQEYGDSYDIMGGAGTTGQYNAQGKNQIRWLPSSFIEPISQSGLYRIYAFDTSALDPSKRYAMTIVKDTQRTYWGMVRTLFDSNPWMKNGIEIGWRYPNGSGGNFQLIDTTNGSPFLKEDAAISLGSTFSDTEAGIHMTTVATNNSPRYVDVQVNFGSFPANNAPTMTLAASATSVPLNATVTFTATASDADSDPLAYAWQHFGDAAFKTVSPNANVITRQFTAAGTFVVACTASDMKGGTVTRNQLITVGSPTTFTISGRITIGGAGLSDVVVTANNANGVITDADGYFTVANLTANTYSLTPLLYGYTFSELFNNSITVGPSFNGASFDATASSVVTIAATTNASEPNTNGSFTLTRTGDTSQDLVVNVNSAIGSATITTDYTLTPAYVAGSLGFSTFTILAGSSTLSIGVAPASDTSQEGPETIILQLGPGNGYIVGSASSATMVLGDDDTALPKIAFTASTARTTEGSVSPAQFTVTRTGVTTATLTVTYAVSGTATSGTDFTALAGSVVIPANASSATIDITTTNDSTSESLENVVLTLSSNAAYVIDPTANIGTASIYDDDLQTVSVTASAATAVEVDLSVPGAAANTGTFLVSRSGDVTAPLTVYYAFSGVTGSGTMALHGVDYEAMPGSIIIPAGQSAASITVVPRFDALGEGPEQVVLSLGANATNYLIGSSASATVTISDNATDVPYVDVVNTGSANEAGSAVFRITVRGGTGTGTLAVSYVLSGTAIAADYTVSGTGNTTTGTSITLNNGATVTKDITINNTQDAVLEDLENVTLTLTPSAAYQLYSATTSATMWLRDNDNVNTVFVDTQVGTSGSDTVTEGTSSNPTKFYVSRTGSTTAALTVNYTISGTATSGSDYTALTGSVVIPAAALGVDVPVVITNDTDIEGTESIVFDFAAGSYSRSMLPATMFIADNEVPTTTVGFAMPSSSGLESITSVNLPVTLSAAAPVSVAYKVSSQTGSGLANTLNTQPLSYWVRLVKTGTSVAFQQSNDGQAWTTRVTGTVSNLGNTSYLAGIAFAPGSTTATQAVIDNFSITSLSAGGTQGTETDAAIGTATGAPAIASGTYTFNNTGAGMLNAGTSDNFRYVYLPITNSANCTVTARVVSIGGTASTNSRAGVMLRSSTAVGSVFASGLANNMANSTAYDLNRTTTSAASNSPSGFSTLLLPIWTRIQRAGDVFTHAHSRDGVTWTNFTTTPAIAFGPTALAGLVVAAGNDGNFVTATFDNVTLTGNPITSGLGGRSIGFVNEQGSESFNSGTNVWTMIGSGSSLGTGGDEGYFPSMEVSGDFTLVSRLTSFTGTVTTGQAGVMVRGDRNGYARSAATVYNRNGTPQLEQRYKLQSVTTAFGTGIDYTLAEGILTFDGIETSKNIVLNVNNDSMDEPNNLVTLQLFNPVGANLPAAQAYHGYTIIDDDNPPAQPFVGFAASTSSVAENAGTALIAVSLSAPATANGSVDYATANGTALDTSDYTSTSGTLSFVAGDSVAYITVPIIDDAILESSETLTLTLTNPVGLQFGTITTHTLTITDDDSPSVSIVANDASATEAGDPGQFTLTRTGPTTSALAVTLTRAGTGTSGTDYTAINTAQTIPIGSSSLLINVTPIQDVTNEGAETVILTVASGSGYVVGTPSSGTVTIADDDRSTVTIIANDASASENAGNGGQFTITRTAPTTASLSVAFTVAGTATNGTDYTTITSPVTIAAGQTSAVVNVAVTNDGSIEGPEDVTLSLNTGTYDIGAASFASVSIADNDIPPTVFIDSPDSQGPLIAAANGVIVHAQIADDGTPAATTQTWSCVSGPGAATIETPTAVTTAVTFSAPGTYVLRVSATDTQFTVSDQITIVVGSGAVAANWFTQDMTPSSSQRGQSLEFNGIATVTGTGAGYATATDSAHIMVRPATGDGSVVARLTSLSSTTALSGVTIRDSLARSGTRAVLGYVPGTGLQFRIRTTVSTTDTVTTTTGLTLPLWLKLERNSTTNEITASHSPNGTTWTAIGIPTIMPLLNTDAHYGLTTTSNSTAGTATGVFDNITLTPTPSGPALLNEDSGTAPNIAGSGSFDGTTYSVSGSPTGYFYGWQYYGDLDIRTRLVNFPSGAGSSSGGIRIAESIESGAQMHLGRMPTSSYNGYYWTNLAGGSSGGVPSGISPGNWMRIVRSGNSLVGYRATHNTSTNGPNAWTQIGQPQTVIMSTPVWVGFYVNNASGVGLNPCTFTNLTVSPLSKAPIIAATASGAITPITLDGTITDDNLPNAFTSLWSQRTGPTGLTFANATLTDTTATLTNSGTYGLRLTADDTSTQSFFNVNFTAYTTPFAQWLGTNSVGNPNNLITEADADMDNDGLANLFEYAVGTNGTLSSTNPQVTTLAPVSADKYLRISIPKSLAATDVTFEVQATSDLTNPLSWSSADLVIEENTPSLLKVRDYVPAGPGVKRFMRVKVTRP